MLQMLRYVCLLLKATPLWSGQVHFRAHELSNKNLTNFKKTSSLCTFEWIWSSDKTLLSHYLGQKVIQEKMCLGNRVYGHI